MGFKVIEMRYFDKAQSFIDKKTPLVDLRSPSEFKKGFIPCAQNVPLLTDDERHRVGLLYKEEGRLSAIQLGFELFAQKAEGFATQIEAIAKPGETIAVHCLRGGMRSGSVARFLATIGYDVLLLSGGYKQYRQDVLEQLEKLASHSLIVLNGRTGSGKSDFLLDLPPGFPYLDFEKLAVHRGSAFGGFNQPSSPPTQQLFENKLADQYFQVASYREIVVEIENYIGPIEVPRNVRANIVKSPMVFFSREFEDRVTRLEKEYVEGWNENDDEAFEEKMAYFKRYFSAKDRDRVIAAVKARDFRTAVSFFLKQHYDRLYDKSLKRHQNQMIATYNLTHQYEEVMAFFCDRCFADGSK